MKGKCKTCGETITARKSKKASAQANYLKAVRRHYKEKHPNTIGRRISKGLRNRNENPSIQDMVEALRSSPRAALDVYKNYTERQYQHMKRVMDALEPVLPAELV